jgi:LL-diaminopimelate aminotransferase
VAVEFHSCSKSFNMAGVRIGFVAGRSDAIDVLLAYRSNVGYGVSMPVQYAGAFALDNVRALTAPIVAEYQGRRDALYSAFVTAGWNVVAPQAAMYAWLPLPEHVAPWDAVERLLLEARVMVTPGLAFGAAGERYFRLSLVAPAPVLHAAGIRIAQTFAAVPA